MPTCDLIEAGSASECAQKKASEIPMPCDFVSKALRKTQRLAGTCKVELAYQVDVVFGDIQDFLVIEILAEYDVLWHLAFK